MSLVREVEEAFAPEGPLARAWPRFEPREGQRALALDVARALERGEVLVAEAPTGVGKSLAYLLPCVLHALATDRRIVVATCTRSLQDQLFERDVPTLLAALGAALPVARLKGKQNYVCPRALDLLEPEGDEEADAVDALRAWAARDAEGDLDRFEAPDAEAFRRLRPRVATDAHACVAAQCRRGRECAWMRARRLAAEARLVIVNHALLALAGEVEGLLPEFDALVVDEAHRLEGVLLSQLQRTLSRTRFEDALRAVGTGRRGGGGLVARFRALELPLLAANAAEGGEREVVDGLALRVPAAREDVERFFELVAPPAGGAGPYGVRARYQGTAQLVGQDLDRIETLLVHCARFARDLRRLAARLEGLGERHAELAAETEQVAGRFAGLGDDLEVLGDASDRDWVFWRSAGGRGTELSGMPITAAEHARAKVFARARATVLASATLASGGRFEFVAERLGLGEERGVPYVSGLYPTPFPLERQVRAFVHDGGADEAAAVANVVASLARASGRNLLALFTAHERLRRARERLRALLPAGVPLFAQEWDGPAGLLAERFRRERGAILLGVQSLWEGVDFPGESLEILVVAKLPFSVPDDPLVEARGERLRDRGLEPFKDDAVPEAVLRFRQGVGRLIRRADDRGVLVVCDPRLERASYRRPFLEALPVAPVRRDDAAALAAEAERFLASGAPAGERA